MTLVALGFWQALQTNSHRYQCFSTYSPPCPQNSGYRVSDLAIFPTIIVCSRRKTINTLEPGWKWLTELKWTPLLELLTALEPPTLYLEYACWNFIVLVNLEMNWSRFWYSTMGRLGRGGVVWVSCELSGMGIGSSSNNIHLITKCMFMNVFSKIYRSFGHPPRLYPILQKYSNVPNNIFYEFPGSTTHHTDQYRSLDSLVDCLYCIIFWVNEYP